MTKQQKIQKILSAIYRQAEASTLKGVEREYEYIRLKRIAEKRITALGGDWHLMAESVCGHIYDLL